MDFEFTEEQQRFREEVRDFCQTMLHGESDVGVGTIPHSKSDASVEPDFPPEFFHLYRKVAGKGWMGLILPKEYGGQGRGRIEDNILHEELAAHGLGGALGPYGTTVNLAATILLKHGSEQQKRFYLPRIARGEIWVGQAFTEAVGGSDLLSNTTRATRQGDHYVINGEKMFNSWAHEGQYICQYGIRQYALLLARTDQNAPPDKSLSLFIFDGTTPLPGMTIRPIMTPMRRTNEVFFDDVRIPAESLLGEEDQAWDYVVESGAFYWNKRNSASDATFLKKLLQELVQYVKETQVDGRSLSENALVRHKLAELAIRIEGIRLHAYRLAWALDKGLDITGLGAITKFQGDRLRLYFSNSAMQLLGPYAQLERGAKYAPLKGTIESMYKVLIGDSFSSTGPSAMPSVIAGYVLGLPNEFGLIY